jgi:hypothetical protein
MLKTERYIDQVTHWPQEGRHIMAQFDDESIVVYQAYRPAIGSFAAQHGHFCGEFSYSRMSWIKPNFLWMMYRSGWGTKEGQDVTLALRIRRTFFDQLLAAAVASTYTASRMPTREAWQDAMARSSVRLQWDPDHDPSGTPLARRAIQLGLRGPTLNAFGREELLEVLDLSAFVAEQRANVPAERRSQLMVPTEAVYRPNDDICEHVGLDRRS